MVVVEDFLEGGGVSGRGRFSTLDLGFEIVWVGVWGGCVRYLDCDEDVQVVIPDVFVLVDVELVGAVLAHNEGVLGQALEEAFRRRAVDVEVEGVHGDEERGCDRREKGEEGAHAGSACSGDVDALVRVRFVRDWEGEMSRAEVVRLRGDELG